MRSSKEIKFKKRSFNSKIKKKRIGRSWYFPFGTSVSDRNIENINEALRKNKSASCDSKSSWKLLPKDSCEVYRNRRRRLRNQSNDGSMSDGQLTMPSKQRVRKGRRVKRDKKKQKPKRKIGRRPRSESTMHSESDSLITKSSMSVCSYCASSSDMES